MNSFVPGPIPVTKAKVDILDRPRCSLDVEIDGAGVVGERRLPAEIQGGALLRHGLEDLKRLVSQGGDVKAHKIDLDLTHLTLGAIHRSQRHYTKALENYSKVQGEIYRDEATVSISQINNLWDKLQPEDFNE